MTNMVIPPEPGPDQTADEPLEPELLAFVEALARADAAADFAKQLAEARTACAVG